MIPAAEGEAVGWHEARAGQQDGAVRKGLGAAQVVTEFREPPLQICH